MPHQTKNDALGEAPIPVPRARPGHRTHIYIQKNLFFPLARVKQRAPTGQTYSNARTVSLLPRLELMSLGVDMAKWTGWGMDDPGEWQYSERNWHCSFCVKEHGRPDRRDDVPEFILRKDTVDLPERLACCFEFTRNRQKAYFCSARCMAQVQLPPLDIGQLDSGTTLLEHRDRNIGRTV